jgi:hypothetical protein
MISVAALAMAAIESVDRIAYEPRDAWGGEE